MRPTDLKFRFINERTPEHPEYVAEITRDGKNLFAGI